MIAPTLLVLIVFVLFVVVIALELYNMTRLKKLMEPTYELELQRADEAAANIVERAREEARRLLEKAEADSSALTAARASKEHRAEQHYDQDLHALLTAFKGQLTDAARAAGDSYRRAGEELLGQATQYDAEVRDRAEKLYAELEKSAKTQLEEHVARAFKAAQEVALTYERARKNAIDAHIREIVGKTMQVVLQKQPEEVSAELVRAALNEAKANTIF